jgi:hypothetical protein
MTTSGRASFLDSLALHSHRDDVLTLTVLAVICLLQASALPARAQQSISPQKKKVVSLSLKLQREIPFEHPLVFPPDDAWLMQSVIAMHPDGKRALVLIPAEAKVALRPRSASGLSERGFLLAWVELATGRLLTTRELLFFERESFGFSMAPSGDFFCLIAGQKVMILDESLTTVDWTQAEISDPQGKKRWATSCAFVPGTPDEVLVAYSFFGGPPWEWRTSLMQWNWKEKAALLVHWDLLVPESVPLREDHVLIYRALPNWVFRFLVEEVDLRTREASSGREFEGFHAAQLVPLERIVLRVDFASHRGGGIDVAKQVTVPERFEDLYKQRQWGVRVPYRGTPNIEGPSGHRINVPEQQYISTDGRVEMWDRGSTRRATEFRFGGAALQWPLCVAHDGSWFVVRAVKFSQIAENFTLLWDFNQFLVFSLDGSKRRLYTSEKFGPDEAITGFGLSRDDKTLLVSTSSRLLVYEIKQY